jgi:hypothetical protein
MAGGVLTVVVTDGGRLVVLIVDRRSVVGYLDR